MLYTPSRRRRIHNYAGMSGADAKCLGAGSLSGASLGDDATASGSILDDVAVIAAGGAGTILVGTGSGTGTPSGVAVDPPCPEGQIYSYWADGKPFGCVYKTALLQQSQCPPLTYQLFDRLAGNLGCLTPVPGVSSGPGVKPASNCPWSSCPSLPQYPSSWPDPSTLLSQIPQVWPSLPGGTVLPSIPSTKIPNPDVVNPYVAPAQQPARAGLSTSTIALLAGAALLVFGGLAYESRHR